MLIARTVFFDELADPTKPYYINFRRLSTFLTVQDRLDSLYYDVTRNQLPEDQYAASFVAELWRTVMQFAREVRGEIP